MARGPDGQAQEETHIHGRRGATPESELLHRAAAHCHAAFAYFTTLADEVQDLEDLLCLIDCADLCTVTAGFVVRDAHHADELRGLCLRQIKDVLEVLADYPRDEVMRACAEVLQEAEDALHQQVDGGS